MGGTRNPKFRQMSKNHRSWQGPRSFPGLYPGSALKWRMRGLQRRRMIALLTMPAPGSCASPRMSRPHRNEGVGFGVWRLSVERFVTISDRVIWGKLLNSLSLSFLL